MHLGNVPTPARHSPPDPEPEMAILSPSRSMTPLPNSEDSDGSDPPQRNSVATDEGGTRQDTLGPRAKSLGLPLTHYPLKTLLILFPKSYPASKATPAHGVKKPSPSLQLTSTMPRLHPQSHPNSRQATGPLYSPVHCGGEDRCY